MEMRILIVDDDITVQGTIKALIEKNTLDFEIIGAAFNGEEAFELYKELAPDIIITDMKMPVIDGLTFMSWINASEHICKVIVLSGYDDFSYTRSAFLMDAVDYLLKPVNEIDLINVLTQTAELVHKQNPNASNDSNYSYKGLAMVQEEFLSEITFNDIDDENSMIVKAHQQKLTLPQDVFSIITIKLQNTQQCLIRKFNGNLNEFYDYIKTLIQNHFDFEGTIIFRQFYKTNEFVIIHTIPYEEKVQTCIKDIYTTLKEELQIISVVGISKQCEYAENIFYAYQQATDAFKNTKLNDNEFMCKYGDPIASNSEEWLEIIKLMDCIIENKSIYNFQDLLLRIQYVFSDEYMQNLTLNDITENVTIFIKKINIIINNDNKSNVNKDKIHTILNSISKHLEQHNIRRVMKYSGSLLPLLPALMEGYSYTEHQFIEEIKEYIEINYKDVTLTDISSHFFLNKNYFSTLFRTLTTKTFSDYLLEVRVAKAAYLLKNTSLKVYEISQHVGYEDSRYFSQVFKKAFDVQPTEYRNSDINQRNTSP